ncbi:MAG: DUF6522 family protein [Luteimonas sp.]|nr:DUF6522 family protein [Luteimonas sp.]
MKSTIPITLAPRFELEIDGALVASGLALDVAEFRKRMDEGRVTVLCERGTGDDLGLYRASFYHGTRRVRIVVDRDGTPVHDGYSAGEMPRR